MHSITEQVASEMDVLYGLYQLAIDYSRCIKPDDNVQIVKWLDARQRILSKTAIASDSAKKLLHTFESTVNIPANEKALIEEKKYMLRDILKRMQWAEHDIIRKMREKMKNIRGELAGIGYRKKAAQAYISAPGAVTMVA